MEFGHPLEQIYSLRAPSKEELVKWLKVFEKFVRDKRDYDDWHMMHRPAPQMPVSSTVTLQGSPW